MPQHGYSTDRHPPTVRDHIYAHPYAFCVHGFQLSIGALVLVALVFRFEFTSSVLRLPRGPLFALCLVLIFGGISVFRGLLDDSNNLRKGFRVERGGLILSGAAWTAYGICVLIANPLAIPNWSLAGFFSLAMGLRIAAGRREENRIAREMRDLKL